MPKKIATIHELLAGVPLICALVEVATSQRIAWILYFTGVSNFIMLRAILMALVEIHRTMR